MRQTNTPLHLERHQVKLNLLFHQLQLNVKFSCKISLSIKSHHKIANEITPKPLSNGLCEINQEMVLDWQYQYLTSRGQYSNSIMEIDILVHSTKGIIHGGVCSLDITKNYNRIGFPLKKCSDKSAILTISCSSNSVQSSIDLDSSNVKNSFQQYPKYDQKKISRVRSQDQLHNPLRQSMLSISKISVSSNSRLQKYLRNENENLGTQNDLLKEKIKNGEKKERELFQQLKEITIKHDKLKNKYGEVQGLNQLNQMLIFQKDKCIKHLEHHNLELEFQIQSYLDQIKSFEKKLEHRGDNLSGREERLHQKLGKAEKELNQMTDKYWKLLNSFEEAERTSALTLKEKDRQHSLQKSRLVRQLTQKQDQIQSYLSENNSSIREDDLILNLEKQVRENTKVIDQQKYQLQNLQKQLNHTFELKKDLQQELQQIKRIEEDRLALKKKINQAQFQTNNVKMEQSRANQALTIAQNKIEELLQKNNKLQMLKVRVEGKLIKTQKQLLAKQQDYLKLEAREQELRNEVKELKQGLKTQIRKKEQQIYLLKEQKNQSEEKAQMFLFNKTKIQYQNNDLKQELALLTRNIKQNQFSINTLKDQLNHYQEQIRAFQYQSGIADQKIQQLSQDVIHINFELDNQKSQKRSLAEEVRQLKQVLNQEQNKNFSSGLEKIRECELLQNQVRYLKEKNIELEQTIRTIEQQKQDFKSKKQSSRNDIEQLEEQNYQLKKHLFELETTTDHLNKQIERSLQSEDRLRKKNDEKQQEIRQLTEKASLWEYENTTLKKKDEQNSRYISSLQRQQQSHQIQYEDIFQQLFKIISSDDQIDLSTIIALPFSLTKQLESSVQLRNQFIQRQKRNYDYIRQQKQFIQAEIVKVGQQLFDQTAHYQELYAKEREQFALIKRNYQNQQHRLLQSVDMLREEAAQYKISSENYFRHSMELEHQIEELEKELKHCKDNYEELEDKLKNQQKEVVEINKKYQVLHRKQSRQQKIGEEEKDQVATIQKERLKIQIQTLKRIGKKREEDLNTLNDRNRQLQQKLLQTEIQSKKLDFDMSVQQHIFQELEGKYKYMCQVKNKQQEQIKQLYAELDQKDKKASQKEIIIAQTSSKSIEQQGILAQAKEQNQILKKQIEELRQNIEDREFQIRQAHQKYKDCDEQCHNLRKKNQEDKNQFSRNIEIYKVLIEQAEGVIKDHQGTKADLEEELDSKKMDLFKLQGQTQLLKRQVIREQTSRQAIEQQFDLLMLNYEHCKSQLCLQQEQKSTLTLKLEQTEQKLRKKEQQCRLQIQQITLQHSRQLDNSRRSSNFELVRQKQVENSYKQLKQQYMELKEKYEKQEAVISQEESRRQRIVQQYQEQIQQFMQELSKLQQKNQQLCQDHRYQTSDLLKQIQSLHAQCTQLHHHLVHTSNAKQQHQRTIEDLHSKLAEQNEIIKCQDQESTQFMTEKEESTLETMRLRNYYEDIKNQMAGGNLFQNLLQELRIFKESIVDKVGEQQNSQLLESCSKIQQKMSKVLKMIK